MTLQRTFIKPIEVDPININNKAFDLTYGSASNKFSNVNILKNE